MTGSGTSPRRRRPPARDPELLLRTRLAFSIPETAMILGVSEGLLYLQLRRGKLRTVKLGSRTLIPRQVIDAFLETGEWS